MRKLIYAIVTLLLFVNCDKDEIKKNIEFALSEFIVSIDSATSEVVLDEIEGYKIKTSGVVFSINENPTISDIVFEANFVENTMIVTINDLQADTVYYSRAFITMDSNETFYSEQVAFNTYAIETSIPDFAQISVSEISDTKATFTSAISDDKGYDIINKGFIYSISENFEQDIETVEITNSEFNLTATELIGGTKYYVKAYGENDYGTFYSDVVSFDTEYTEKPYVGDLTLASQAEVDAFVTEKYTSIEGVLIIGVYPAGRAASRKTSNYNEFYSRYDEYDEPTSDISDISGLKSIKHVFGELYIMGSPNIGNLNGLENIVSKQQEEENILISLYIVNNDGLLSLEGLEGIVNAEEIYVYDNDSLTDLSGLESLITTKYLIVEYNEELLSFTGLGNLVSSTDFMFISKNDKITDLNGLASLEVANGLTISLNDSLESLNGIENLSYSGVGRYSDSSIHDNPVLVDYSALETLINTVPEEGKTGVEAYVIENNLYVPSIEELTNGKYNISDSDKPVDEAAVLWLGENITFTKEDYANHTLEENQDIITIDREVDGQDTILGVSITRADSWSIFNINSESGQSSLSPVGTKWAYGTIAHGVENLSFNSFLGKTTYGASFIAGKNMVLHLEEENIYIDIKFTSWTSGQNGGGFSYERSTETPE